jgi:hypothetical protein
MLSEPIKTTSTNLEDILLTNSDHHTEISKILPPPYDNTSHCFILAAASQPNAPASSTLHLSLSHLHQPLSYQHHLSLHKLLILYLLLNLQLSQLHQSQGLRIRIPKLLHTQLLVHLLREWEFPLSKVLRKGTLMI